MFDRRDTLRRLRREEVAIRRWPHDDIPPEYFHLVDASLPLVFGSCGHAFEQDELDLVSQHAETDNSHRTDGSSHWHNDVHIYSLRYATVPAMPRAVAGIFRTCTCMSSEDGCCTSESECHPRVSCSECSGRRPSITCRSAARRRTRPCAAAVRRKHVCHYCPSCLPSVKLSLSL